MPKDSGPIVLGCKYLCCSAPVDTGFNAAYIIYCFKTETLKDITHSSAFREMPNFFQEALFEIFFEI